MISKDSIKISKEDCTEKKTIFLRKKERIGKKKLEIADDFLYNADCCDLDSVEA
ncbi:MAG: hypothetical protein LUH00_02885 [Lachnospiraceae bacterium]|nr:hypothetical protein [Lachnospiraceae bacterium]